MVSFVDDWNQSKDSESRFFKGVNAVWNSPGGPVSITAPTLDQLRKTWLAIVGVELKDQFCQLVEIRPSLKGNNSLLPIEPP